jgi:hypothetical protein
MLISATSALVLYWTSPEIWTTANARNYFAHLDLREGKTLYDSFSKAENEIETEVLTNRKYFVRKHIVSFLEGCEKENKSGQVIVLAAGIAPLSVEIATLFPNAIVFDVDKYAMPEKEKYLQHVCRNIRFIECDITQVDLLEKKLKKAGWDPASPTIVVVEGIVYYLKESDLWNILHYFANQQSRLILDFVLKPDCVDEQFRKYGVDVFERIREWIGLKILNFYEPDFFMEMIAVCGFKKAKRFEMDEIQMERTGKSEPFDDQRQAWVCMVKNF